MATNIEWKVGNTARTHGGWKAEVIQDDESYMPLLVRHMSTHGDTRRVWHYRSGRSNLNLAYCRASKDYDLVARWEDDTPANIVLGDDGVEYDICAGKIYPLGMLPKNVQQEIKNWPHGLEVFDGNEWRDKHGRWYAAPKTYRAKPAPQPETYVLYWYEGHDAFDEWSREDTHKLILTKHPDGKVTCNVEELGDDDEN